ncbi:MAG: carbohydrate binding family 9 domain-containing protein, partial [Acidobacteria bacterium]|nr:carbohydrate binding family 9 domain-containing protein [Acidobacteriota bacterium]
MKNLFAVLILLSSILCVNAQPSSAVVQSGNSVVEVKRDDPPKKSAVKIPSEKANPVSVPKISQGLTIDGKIDEELWKNAAVFKDFYQVQPGNNIAPSKPTEVLMMYDEKNLYIAFKCWDEKDKIRASVASRDGVFGEDNVRVWLDTYDDQRRAYVLGFNPLGIQQDGIYSEGQEQGADFSVDIVMESKGVIEDWGWSVEAKIPFKSLR